MIESFGDSATEDLFHGRDTARARRIPTRLHLPVLGKLDALNAATTLDDLRAPPGNRLEALRGALRGLPASGSMPNGAWSSNGSTATRARYG
jgi:toxin HigB-1